MHRRSFLGVAAGLPLLPAGAAAAPADAFDPDAWLKKHKIGRLSTRTPQSGKPLHPPAAKTLGEWREERALYERAKTSPEAF